MRSEEERRLVTDDERERMREMRERGMNPYQIARELGRGYPTVCKYTESIGG